MEVAVARASLRIESADCLISRHDSPAAAESDVKVLAASRRFISSSLSCHAGVLTQFADTRPGIGLDLLLGLDQAALGLGDRLLEVTDALP